jgi:hypothetical protein
MDGWMDGWRFFFLKVNSYNSLSLTLFFGYALKEMTVLVLVRHGILIEYCIFRKRFEFLFFRLIFGHV